MSKKIFIIHVKTHDDEMKHLSELLTMNPFKTETQLTGNDLFPKVKLIIELEDNKELMISFINFLCALKNSNMLDVEKWDDDESVDSIRAFVNTLYAVGMNHLLNNLEGKDTDKKLAEYVLTVISTYENTHEKIKSSSASECGQVVPTDGVPVPNHKDVDKFTFYIENKEHYLTITSICKFLENNSIPTTSQFITYKGKVYIEFRVTLDVDEDTLIRFFSCLNELREKGQLITAEDNTKNGIESIAVMSKIADKFPELKTEINNEISANGSIRVSFLIDLLIDQYTRSSALLANIHQAMQSFKHMGLSSKEYEKRKSELANKRPFPNNNNRDYFKQHTEIHAIKDESDGVKLNIYYLLSPNFKVKLKGLKAFVDTTGNIKTNADTLFPQYRIDLVRNHEGDYELLLINAGFPPDIGPIGLTDDNEIILNVNPVLHDMLSVNLTFPHKLISHSSFNHTQFPYGGIGFHNGFHNGRYPNNMPYGNTDGYHSGPYQNVETPNTFSPQSCEPGTGWETTIPK